MWPLAKDAREVNSAGIRTRAKTSIKFIQIWALDCVDLSKMRNALPYLKLLCQEAAARRGTIICVDNEGAVVVVGDSERQKGEIRGFKQASRQASSLRYNIIAPLHLPLAARERGEKRKKCSNGSSLSSPEPREEVNSFDLISSLSLVRCLSRAEADSERNAVVWEEGGKEEERKTCMASKGSGGGGGGGSRRKKDRWGEIRCV